MESVQVFGSIIVIRGDAIRTPSRAFRIIMKLGDPQWVFIKRDCRMGPPTNPAIGWRGWTKLFLDLSRLTTAIDLELLLMIGPSKVDRRGRGSELRLGDAPTTDMVSGRTGRKAKVLGMALVGLDEPDVGRRSLGMA
jgi:hypothetical protein